MPPAQQQQRQPLLPAGGPQSRRGDVFDPWHSVSAGHQRAEGGGPGVAWREVRNAKLGVQYGGGGGAAGVRDGGVGVGGRKAGVSVAEMLARPGSMRRPPVSGGDGEEGEGDRGLTGEERLLEKGKEGEDEEKRVGGGPKRGVFEGLVVYVNGSTYPLISDHRLKQVLAENGARMSLHLGRRRVTHVILGRPGAVGRGAGGGLAGGKMEREIKRVGGCGVKYVGVEWVLESIKAGKRLPEARFANLKVARSGQGSVYATYAKST